MPEAILAALSIIKTGLELLEKATVEDIDLAHRRTDAAMQSYTTAIAAARARRAEAAGESGAWEDGGGEHAKV